MKCAPYRNEETISSHIITTLFLTSQPTRGRAPVGCSVRIQPLRKIFMKGLARNNKNFSIVPVHVAIQIPLCKSRFQLGNSCARRAIISERLRSANSANLILIAVFIPELTFFGGAPFFLAWITQCGYMHGVGACETSNV